jgi:hypothetical protein
LYWDARKVEKEEDEKTQTQEKTEQKMIDPTQLPINPVFRPVARALSSPRWHCNVALDKIHINAATYSTTSATCSPSSSYPEKRSKI